MSNYPPSLPEVNQTAPAPRRIRAVLNGRVVLDTTSALYVWEWEHYPQYYIPVTDVDAAVLVDEQHEQKLSRGAAPPLRAGGGRSVTAFRAASLRQRCPLRSSGPRTFRVE